MTLPTERTRAVIAARDFLHDLLVPNRTPRVPREIRERAYNVLRHYPWTTDILRTCKKFPEVWEWPPERLAGVVLPKRKK